MEGITETELMAMQFLLSGITDAPNVGDMFTTAKSAIRGEVCEIVRNRTGSFRLRLVVDGVDRWTTATADYLHSGEWK
jgi:hypothetical protein